MKKIKSVYVFLILSLFCYSNSWAYADIPPDSLLDLVSTPTCGFSIQRQSPNKRFQIVKINNSKTIDCTLLLRNGVPLTDSFTALRDDFDGLLEIIPNKAGAVSTVPLGVGDDGTIYQLVRYHAAECPNAEINHGEELVQRGPGGIETVVFRTSGTEGIDFGGVHSNGILFSTQTSRLSFASHASSYCDYPNVKKVYRLQSGIASELFDNTIIPETLDIRKMHLISSGELLIKKTLSSGEAAYDIVSGGDRTPFVRQNFDTIWGIDKDEIIGTREVTSSNSPDILVRYNSKLDSAIEISLPGTDRLMQLSSVEIGGPNGEFVGLYEPSSFSITSPHQFLVTGDNQFVDLSCAFPARYQKNSSLEPRFNFRNTSYWSSLGELYYNAYSKTGQGGVLRLHLNNLAPFNNISCGTMELIPNACSSLTTRKRSDELKFKKRIKRNLSCKINFRVRAPSDHLMKNENAIFEKFLVGNAKKTSQKGKTNSAGILSLPIIGKELCRETYGYTDNTTSVKIHSSRLDPLYEMLVEVNNDLKCVK